MLLWKWSLSRLKIQPCLYYEWRWNPRWCLGVLRGWVLVAVAVLVRLLLAGSVKTAGDRLLLSVVVRLAGLAAGTVWRFGYKAGQCIGVFLGCFFVDWQLLVFLAVFFFLFCFWIWMFRRFFVELLAGEVPPV